MNGLSLEPRKRTISIPSTMFTLGLRLFTLSLLVSIHDAQRVQLHNCAKMILITGKFWPCIVWQRPNATTTTSTSTTDAPTSTEEGRSSTTEGSTTEEITTMDTTTTEIPSTIPSTTRRREKTTTKKETTTTEEVSTSEVSSTTIVPSTTTRIEETTTEEEETTATPTTTNAVITTEIRPKRIKPSTSTPSSTTSSSPSTTTEEEDKRKERTTKMTTKKPSTTTEEVEIKVVTKQTKKGESSTSESMEVEEEEIFGVVQSTTPPPYFVTLLTDRSRDEFYRIAKNPFLTKAELLYRIRRWASKQPKLVREAIFDIEHELIRQQASVRKEAGAILEALPLAFLQYTNIRDNVALTKQEEQEDLDALYKAMPRKTAKVLRYVLMMAGDSFDTARREENKLRQFSVQSFRSTIRDTLG